MVCVQCGGVVEGKLGTRFCSDQCRYDFHNNQRKIKTKQQKILTTIEELALLVDDAQELYQLFEEIEARLQELTPVGVWQCSCGQRRFTKPAHEDTCDFCGKAREWRFTRVFQEDNYHD